MTRSDIYVLVACEKSQVVCTAFRKRGFNAFSCDIEPCLGNHPEWHIKADIFTVSDGLCDFYTQDGVKHSIPYHWDLVIAHPPCTRLCLSGQRWLYYGSQEYREKKMLERMYAINFFYNILAINTPFLAVENPIGIMSNLYRKPDQIYNPYDFLGETECKKTCLWLSRLPLLKPTQSLPVSQRTHNIFKACFNGKQYAWNDKRVASLRSVTPNGVAEAMAEQWGKYVEDSFWSLNL